MPAVPYDANDLIRLFAEDFADSHRTRLVAGGDEPLYRPAATPDGWHEIVFRHDYFQSALHEIAHWCVAGDARRRLTDYGYWYDPDGRTAARQDEFERVEARPQAVEWVLTQACGKPFRVSLDNLDASEPLNESSLWQAVHAAVVECLAGGLPPRAARYAQRLSKFYGQPWPPALHQFVLPPVASPDAGDSGAGAPMVPVSGGANSSV